MYTHERKQYVNFEIFLLEMLKSKYFNIIFIELEHNCLLAVVFFVSLCTSFDPCLDQLHVSRQPDTRCNTQIGHKNLTTPCVEIK